MLVVDVEEFENMDVMEILHRNANDVLTPQKVRIFTLQMADAATKLS